MVVAAIGILATLTIGAVQSLGGRGDDIRCITNLRETGAGILAYSLDHDGKLPGPVLSGVFPYYSDAMELSWHLADYLDLEKRRVKRWCNDVFLCPGYVKSVAKVGDGPCYTLNVEVHFSGETQPLPPFGYPNSYHPVVFNTKIDYQPMNILRLSDVVDSDGKPARSTTWMMMDADQLDPRWVRHKSRVIDKMPKTMVHGDHRNTLFFDFHVGRTNGNYEPL
jgi:prepilin-type processing-associated H-X9-DG protein